MAYSPAAITAVYTHVHRALPSMERSGVLALKAGYHNSRNNHQRNRPNDYSIQRDVDREGDGDAASAIDMKFNTRELGIVCRRLMAASKAKDPRLQGKIREWFGSFDGKNLTGYSLYRDEVRTSDPSHLWHLHISGYRKYANDKQVWLGITEVILGLQVGSLTRAPDPGPVVVIKPANKAPTFELVAELDAPGAGNWQGATRNMQTGEWFLCEKREGLCIFHRFNPDHKYRDSMTVTGQTGQTSFGVSDTNILWFTHNGGGVNDVVTKSYEPGKTVDKSDCTPMHVFTIGNAQITFNPTRDWAVIRRVMTDTETYKRYRKEDILADEEKQWGKTVTVNRSDDRVVQGFSTVGESVYILTGKSNGPAFIEKRSFVTGQLERKVDITHLGFEGGEPSGKREPEGADGRHFGIKVWEGDTAGADGHHRVLRIFTHDI